MLSVVSRSLLLTVMMTVSLSALAAKTDIVYLHNGDRITGEIKGLDRGRLKFSTDHMGTVFIEWEDILEIVSNKGQAVELKNGQRFHGSLEKPENDAMVMVSTDKGAIGVNTMDVVSMYPVESGFWERLETTASLGFSWDKGSGVGKYNLGLDSEFRRPESITRGGLSSELTTQDTKDDTSRSNIFVNHLVFRKNKKYIDYFGNLESNDELGIDVRALVGAGYGWVPIRSNRNWFTIGGGLAVNREIPTNGDAENNLEGVAILNYEYYKYSSPERKFSVRLVLFPSLTDFGRWRADFNTDFRFELVNDFFWVLDFYVNYDSDPISLNASTSDYGITSSLAYKF